MTWSRLAMAHVCGSIALASSLAGCLAHERDEPHVDASITNDASSAPDAFVSPDAGGICPFCPAAPPGCVYDGVPCACSHTTCTPIRCGRDVCAPGTVCCNDS